MAKKSLFTTNTQIKAALRQLWLRSRERAQAIKRDNYSCRNCGAKQSRAKGKEVYVEVHHRDKILNWQQIYEVIRECLLCSPDKMETLCKECHKAQEKKDVNK